MSKIPEALLDKIKNSVSISDVISEYVTLVPKGGRLWGLCPFHEEHTPSFTVSEDKGFYHCFGCGKGGSVFNFLMDIENLTFPEAARRLAEKAGIELEEMSEEQQEAHSDKQALYELYKRLAKSFHYILLNKPQAEHAREYLNARKISSSTIEDFMIGYAPADPRWLYGFLSGKKYTDEFLATSGVFSQRNPRYPLFRDRIIFPITDQSGNVIAFGARALDPQDKAKYLNSPETQIFHKKDNLFALSVSLPQIRKSGIFTICEGYFDVLALYEAGWKDAVAPLGTSFTPSQAAKLKRYASKARLLFDSDHAGIEATRKAAILLESLGIESEVIEIEDKDPAEILINSKELLLKKLEKKGINSFTYLINQAKLTYDHESPDGKLSIFNEVRPYLEAIQSNIKLSSSIKTLAELIDSDESGIYSDLKRQRTTGSGRSTGERLRVPEEKISSELYLMLVLVHNRDKFLEVRREIQIDELEDEKAREVYLALEESLREGEMSFENLLERIEREDVRKIILQRFGSDEYEMNVSEVIGDIRRRFKLSKLEQTSKELIKRLRTIEREHPGDIRELQDLLYEKKFIDEEIEKMRNQ